MKTSKALNSRTTLFGSQTHRNSREHDIQSLPIEAENHARNSQQSGDEQASTDSCCRRWKTELQLSPNQSKIKLSRHKFTNQPPLALPKRNRNHQQRENNAQQSLLSAVLPSQENPKREQKKIDLDTARSSRKKERKRKKGLEIYGSDFSLSNTITPNKKPAKIASYHFVSNSNIDHTTRVKNSVKNKTDQRG